MNKPQVEITICMGSSCFSRGNKRLLQVVKDYLEEKGLSETVIFRGSHCMALCDKGPILKIDDKVYQHIDNTQVSKILDAYFSS